VVVVVLVVVVVVVGGAVVVVVPPQPASHAVQQLDVVPACLPALRGLALVRARLGRALQLAARADAAARDEPGLAARGARRTLYLDRFDRAG
jgi:hypothetical protein